MMGAADEEEILRASVCVCVCVRACVCVFDGACVCVFVLACSNAGVSCSMTLDCLFSI